MSSMRRPRAITIFAGCVVAAAALTGCGSSHNEAAQTPGAASTVASAGPSKPGGAAADAIPAKSKLPKQPKGVSTVRAKDPLAPKVAKQVMRDGKTVHPTVKVKGRAKAFTQSVKYTDGVTVKITKMTQGKITGRGPGVFPGRAVTHFYVTVTNGTRKPLSLSAVVVTVTYGSPARLAPTVYDKASIDFSGAIKPGKSGHAVYGYSVPAANLGHVTMTVDLDGVHQLAVFSGKVK